MKMPVEKGAAEGGTELLAADEFFELCRPELRRLAAYVRGSDRSETLRPTVLMHEAYLRFRRSDEKLTKSEALRRFVRLMQEVFLDGVRRRNAQKRGGGEKPLPIDKVACGDDSEVELEVMMAGAVSQVAEASSRQAQVVVLKFFWGLTMEEVAEELGISVQEANADWRLAKLALRRILGKER